jgi:hypothetical protein
MPFLQSRKVKKLVEYRPARWNMNSFLELIAVPALIPPAEETRWLYAPSGIYSATESLAMLLPESITTEEFERALERLALSPGEITGASPATV